MTRSAIRSSVLACLALLSLLGSVQCDEKTGPQESGHPSTFPIEHLGAFYQANGLLEMDRHKEAEAAYRKLMKEAGEDPALLANLSASQVGQQKLAEAEANARHAVAHAPGHPEVALVLNAALQAQNKFEEAVTLVKGIVAAHPNHVEARYALIAVLEILDKETHGQQITNHYEILMRLAPRNMAVVLACALSHARNGDSLKAGKTLDRFRALLVDIPEKVAPHVESARKAVEEADTKTLLRSLTYCRNLLKGSDRFNVDLAQLGPAGMKVPLGVQHPVLKLSGKSPEAVSGDIQFADATDALGLADLAKDASVTRIIVGSVSDDRSPALYALREGKPGRLFVRGKDQFRDETQKRGLDRAPAAVAARFVDLNNDRQLDLVLSCGERTVVYRRQKGDAFQDATLSSGLDACPSLGVVPFDFDHDGDLDLIRWTEDRLFVHRNDGEGKLAAVDQLSQFPNNIGRIDDIQPLDLDDDGDIDLCVTVGKGPFRLRVFSNERLAAFREVTEWFVGLPESFKVRPDMHDFDNDGRLEIIDHGSGQSVEVEDGFTGTSEARPAMAQRDVVSSAVADFDCDGTLDVVTIWSDGTASVPSLKPKDKEQIQAVELDGDGQVDLLTSSGRALRNTSTGVGNWLSVSLVALITGDSRFNAFGLGSTIEVRTGQHYQKRTVRDVTTHFGLGPYNHADVVRVLWPNGNYQQLEFRTSDTMNLAANQVVVEAQELKGSCPYLYAWNGTRFEFVTDVLWRSALGMSIMSGVYGHHGPADDYFKIRSDQLAERDGAYVLQFTEELWETAYFDYCRLFVVDHPPGTDVYVDEKCLPPPYPPFEIFGVHTPRAVTATDHVGRDVSDLLSSRDGEFVRGFTQTRYQGIVEDHDLVMDLGSFEDDEPVRLFLHGWLWPTDASTNVAVSQNPAVSARPPTLAFLNERGEWEPSDLVVGFPSGKNKTLVLDLSGRFKSLDRRVRLSTNFAIFWDHVFFTVGDQSFDRVTTELALSAADLHDRGNAFAAPRVPHGPTIPDYDAIDPDRQWRDLIGQYTRFGDVTELIREREGRYAIVGAGDEVTLRFDATGVPPLPAGWTRDYVIHTDGWLKDGDLNSATGKTVGPLPFHGMPSYPYPAAVAPESEDLKHYHTRYRDQSVFKEKLKRH